MKRVLISVTDKTGLIPFAEWLAGRGCELVSTGGTAKVLREAGLAVTEISEVTGIPEGMGGRIKTLSHKVFGGVLADRSNEDHLQYLADNDMGLFDLVVVNLYDFEGALDKGLSFAETVEQIDIGGPSLLRAAAKNHGSCAVLSHPNQYDNFVKVLEGNSGELPDFYRRKLAAAVFKATNRYDGLIANFFLERVAEDERETCQRIADQGC